MTDSSKIRDNSWKFVVETKPFLKKQTQFFPFLSPKTAFCPKTKPIKPNSKPIKAKFIPFYAKRTQISLFPAQKQRFGEKTKPKQTQTKPIGRIAKMNVSPVLTKRYEKNHDLNEMKTNPNQTQIFIRRPVRRSFSEDGSLGEGGLALFNCNLFVFCSVLAFELLEDLFVQFYQSFELFVYCFGAGDDLSINEEKNDCRHAA